MHSKHVSLNLLNDNWQALGAAGSLRLVPPSTPAFMTLSMYTSDPGTTPPSSSSESTPPQPLIGPSAQYSQQVDKGRVHRRPTLLNRLLPPHGEIFQISPEGVFRSSPTNGLKVVNASSLQSYPANRCKQSLVISFEGWIVLRISRLCGWWKHRRQHGQFSWNQPNLTEF